MYYNSNATPLSAMADTPYTHVILSFLRPTIESDGSVGLILPPKLEPFWGDVPELVKAGKKVLISFGGGLVTSADYAPLAGREAELAEQLAAFVTRMQLDGIDIDYEASDTFHQKRSSGIIDGRAFVIALTRELRARLPAGKYLISHTPQPPYLDPGWHGGPYLDVLHTAGDAIDWISVQYYDNRGFDAPAATHVVGLTQGARRTSYVALVEHPDGPRWPSDRLVVGKPVYHADATSGYIAPAAVIDEIVRPLQARYGKAFGGLMGWQFSNLTADHRDWNSVVGEAVLGADQPE
jgi:chitinase